MSPHLRNLLEDAADDGGRPVQLDLAAVRASGRRATWRQRALVGGGGLAAAAVITSVALVLAPGGAGGFAPANPGGLDEQPPSWGDVVQPLVAAIETSGYDVSSGYEHGVSMANAPEDADAIAMFLTASTMLITDGDAAGAATAAEFNDVSLVQDFVLGEVDPPPLNSEVDGYEYTEQCAVLPVNVHRANFAWEACEETSDGLRRVATGGDAYGEALGITLFRADGSGVSVAISTAQYDRPVGGGEPAAPALDTMPLTAEELVVAAEQMLDIGPSTVPGDHPDIEAETTASPMATPSALPPGSDPCGEEVPPVDECESAGSETIEVGPLVDTLLGVGITADDVGGTGSGGSGGDVAQSVLFRLTDSAGRSGTASIGTANSLEAAPLMNDNTSVDWCAVTPTTLARNFAWDLADDPSTPCSDSDHETSNPLVVVHREPGADAIGATLVRADGSVLSVSVSQFPFPGPGTAGEPLAEVPLDSEAILVVLGHLDSANPMS